MNHSLFRWGIIGPGSIAHSFADAIAQLPDARVVAIGSRSLDRAQAFALKYDVDDAFGSYQELVEADGVDAVYIATPHPQHKENTLACLQNKKPVLCEKPFAMNAKEAAEMIAAASANGVFLMEAMWPRFFPLMSTIKAVIATGEIGELRMVLANFGFRADFDPTSRLFDRALGGGSLLDVGVYPLSLASCFFGTPTTATGVAQIGASGVDEQSAVTLLYSGGEIASITCAIRTTTPHEAILLGTEGSITIAAPFWAPTRVTISKHNGESRSISSPVSVNGYEYEAIETAKQVRAGELESPLMPLSETLQIVKTMDTLRRQFGLRYLSDEAAPL